MSIQNIQHSVFFAVDLSATSSIRSWIAIQLYAKYHCDVYL